MADDDHDDKMLDDTEVRFSLLEIGTKPPRADAPEPISLAKERELRSLRARVGLLEDENNRLKGRLVPSVSTIESHEEKDHRSSSCGFHSQVLVSMETASVTCSICGAELVPMDILREFARNERQFVSSVNSLREERTKLANEIAKLKKQESALRSKVRKKSGYDPANYKNEHDRYIARLYYDLVAENERLRQQLAPKTETGS